MKISSYHIDAFANNVFAGNPAMVCVLPNWLPDKTLQLIATENHLPATAFLVIDENERFTTRWFTPEYEIDLCGHGTLALGYVIFNKLRPNLQEVDLSSPAGLLRLKYNKELITLDFPLKESIAIPSSDLLEKGLGVIPNKVFHYKSERCMTVFNHEDQIKQIKPDMNILKQLGYRGIIVTSRGTNCDFVSRVFYPNKLISEDAVTGSSHCLLIPYWASQLNKKEFISHQLSHRGGELLCKLQDNRVYISGKAILYIEGMITI